MTNSEIICNKIAEQFMLGDFTFENLYTTTPSGKVEICDCLIEYQDYYLVFQVKERETQKQQENIEKWLEKKVYKKAIDQMTKSIELIQNSNNIAVRDKLGNECVLSSTKEYIPIVVFDNDAVSDYVRIYESSRIGTVNIFSLSDFEKALNALYTPFEIVEYIQQRQNLFKGLGVPILLVGERADGATLLANANNEEGVVAFYQEFLGVDNSLETRQLCADFMKMLSMYFYKQIEKHPNYKEIVSRLSQLPRQGVTSFMKKVHNIIEFAENKKTIEPYRLVVRNIDFGMLFYPVRKFEEITNIEMLAFFCDLFLQDCQLKGINLTKVILVVAYFHDDNSSNPIQLNWVYREYDNFPDEQLIECLEKHNPWGK